MLRRVGRAFRSLVRRNMTFLDRHRSRSSAGAGGLAEAGLLFQAADHGLHAEIGNGCHGGGGARDGVRALGASGDPRAFAELVRRHRDRMWAVALRTLRDPEEASDALQEAFISAFRAASSFRAESQVTTWLHRIVVNACLDRVRRRQARPTVPLPET